MEWEYEVIFKLWRLAFLKKKPFALSKGATRYGVGWLGNYNAMDGKTYRSWQCIFAWREVE